MVAQDKINRGLVTVLEKTILVHGIQGNYMLLLATWVTPPQGKEK